MAVNRPTSLPNLGETREDLEGKSFDELMTVYNEVLERESAPTERTRASILDLGEKIMMGLPQVLAQAESSGDEELANSIREILDKVDDNENVPVEEMMAFMERIERRTQRSEERDPIRLALARHVVHELGEAQGQAEYDQIMARVEQAHLNDDFTYMGMYFIELSRSHFEEQTATLLSPDNPNRRNDALMRFLDHDRYLTNPNDSITRQIVNRRINNLDEFIANPAVFENFNTFLREHGMAEATIGEFEEICRGRDIGSRIAAIRNSWSYDEQGRLQLNATVLNENGLMVSATEDFDQTLAALGEDFNGVEAELLELENARRAAQAELNALGEGSEGRAELERRITSLTDQIAEKEQKKDRIATSITNLEHFRMELNNDMFGRGVGAGTAGDLWRLAGHYAQEVRNGLRSPGHMWELDQGGVAKIAGTALLGLMGAIMAIKTGIGIYADYAEQGGVTGLAKAILKAPLNVASNLRHMALPATIIGGGMYLVSNVDEIDQGLVEVYQAARTTGQRVVRSEMFAGVTENLRGAADWVLEKGGDAVDWTKESFDEFVWANVVDLWDWSSEQVRFRWEVMRNLGEMVGRDISQYPQYEQLFQTMTGFGNEINEHYGCEIFPGNSFNNNDIIAFFGSYVDGNANPDTPQERAITLDLLAENHLIDPDQRNTASRVSEPFTASAALSRSMIVSGNWVQTNFPRVEV